MGQWPGWQLTLLKVTLSAADHKNDLEVRAPRHPHWGHHRCLVMGCVVWAAL